MGLDEPTNPSLRHVNGKIQISKQNHQSHHQHHRSGLFDTSSASTSCSSNLLRANTPVLYHKSTENLCQQQPPLLSAYNPLASTSHPQHHLIDIYAAAAAAASASDNQSSSTTNGDSSSSSLIGFGTAAMFSNYKTTNSATNTYHANMMSQVPTQTLSHSCRPPPLQTAASQFVSPLNPKLAQSQTNTVPHSHPPHLDYPSIVDHVTGLTQPYRYLLISLFIFGFVEYVTPFHLI